MCYVVLQCCDVALLCLYCCRPLEVDCLEKKVDSGCCCGVLRCVAVRGPTVSILLRALGKSKWTRVLVGLCCGMLQCAAVCCDATHCSSIGAHIQCVNFVQSVCCGLLQCAAMCVVVCCSALQCAL